MRVTQELRGAGWGGDFTVPRTGKDAIDSRGRQGGSVGCVLIVDGDDGDNCGSDPAARALREVLGGAGYRVHGACDGAAALQHVDRCPPDVILLDPWLPVMDGWTFAALYRSRPGSHAAIFLLGIIDESLELAIGAAGSLREPADAKDVLPLIDSWALRHRMRGGTPAGPAQGTTPSGDAADRARRERLRGLAEEVARTRDAIDTLRHQTLDLCSAEQTRPLSMIEARRLRMLRLESERLYLQLRQFYREFDMLTSPPLMREAAS